ncbi:Cyclin [Phaffia rhodozyma]|uniref:Cyclin n=1 Tax=Phaffia rhodozyma TaxID=264483 RepID=A0A0F7SLW5_PHARH|nr:Cyclin [Phaffia rhodozyma]
MSSTTLINPALFSPYPLGSNHPSSLPVPKTPLTPSKRRQSERNGQLVGSFGLAAEKLEETECKKQRTNPKPMTWQTGESRPSSSTATIRVSPPAEPSTSSAPTDQPGPEESVDQSSRQLPHHYMDADMDDLVILVSSMLSKLIQHNDQVPLLSEHLTRFHSRSPPSISVIEYLRRIVKYTNIEKSPLLILLPYLDAFSVHLPSFTLSSLTVHRFLIASACIASKALCDSFCTNAHYAKVGGIKIGELNLLERELISGLDWSLTCDGSLLQSYYTSLITSYSVTSDCAGSAQSVVPPHHFTQAPSPDSSISSLHVSQKVPPPESSVKAPAR